MKTVTIDNVEYPVYATVAEADTYFKATYGSAWSTVATSDKPKLLVSATRAIDRQEWKGTKVDDTQPLAFPRMIEGKQTDDELLTKACCEEALAIYNNGNSNQYNTDGVQSIKVQDTQITFAQGAEEQKFFSNCVDDLLKPYMYLGIRVLY